jgi:hypothetical protein
MDSNFLSEFNAILNGSPWIFQNPDFTEKQLLRTFSDSMYWETDWDSLSPSQQQDWREILAEVHQSQYLRKRRIIRRAANKHMGICKRYHLPCCMTPEEWEATKYVFLHHTEGKAQELRNPQLVIRSPVTWSGVCWHKTVSLPIH